VRLSLLKFSNSREYSARFREDSAANVHLNMKKKKGQRKIMRTCGVSLSSSPHTSRKYLTNTNEDSATNVYATVKQKKQKQMLWIFGVAPHGVATISILLQIRGLFGRI